MTKRELGTCYYPEHWPEEIWAEDAARMVEIGITWVRIGEFAWSRLEAVPGELTFDWLDRAIAVLADAGLKIVLGTPTATPPRWMADKHPDMFALDENGHVRGFGSRRHYCFSHEPYAKECGRIVNLLAERYGKDDRIAAWQTDNEYGCHDTTISYSDAARKAFQAWLEEKYGDIELLNETWGNVFWSMDYNRFDQIGLPNLTVTEPNPSHVLDFRRFSSDQVVAFNRRQSEILRAHSPAPLIHNYMGRITDFDHYAVGEDLDIASWDSYPLGFLEDRSDMGDAWKRRYMRQGDPDFQAFHHDLYRAVGKGRWWVMEQQPGPVNWAPYNPAPLPGMARLWAWEAFAHGAEVVSYFRWRQAPFAQEQMHAGLLRPDSAPAPAYHECKQVFQELADMPMVEDADAPVALIFDYASDWAWKTQPQGRQFDYFRLVFDFYRGLRGLGLTIDIVSPEADLAGYKLVVAPGVLDLPHNLESTDAVKLIGPRTGSKTDALSIPTPLPPDIDGLDCRITHMESLRPDMPVALTQGGTFQFWFEHLEGTAEVVETTQDGKAAVMAAGTTSYLSGWPDRTAMGRILQRACDAAGLETKNLPDDLRIRETATHRFLFNYGPDPVIWEGEEIEPAGVHWRRRA